ncbi:MULTISPECIES: DUF6094 domain-containing protein [Oceanobacillus]|uniref:DUF6094 domain-containing protein n=1 Tax=Oceanobacillus kimchii TaxID=746691 RepID=A0ABQ5TN70_9BACI|nr:DUF6094 domain-containing protein [Oceanobacillus kimchii]GLO68256.1 hypothetical protein MACH08_40400 [Oceanobacillus kimchii]
MAHIGSKIRAGFFATPERQGEYLAKLFVAEGNGIWFDPTCGEGKILHQLLNLIPKKNEESNILTYGVELDKGRAAIAEQELTKVVQSPIEAMVISNNSFPFVFLNPPYDDTMKVDNSKVERKEYIELHRNTKYLVGGGILAFVIPSYQFANPKIARHLATHYEECGIMSFSKEDYNDFRQCVFIGRKKKGKSKLFGKKEKKLYDFLLAMETEEFVQKYVTPIDIMIGHKFWTIPEGRPEVKTFYSRLRNKSDFSKGILSSKGFEIFKNRATTPTLTIGGDPVLPPNAGQLSLLLASGVINGELGNGDTYHLVQGQEIVETEKDSEEELLDNGTKKTTSTERTKRSVSIKAILPDGTIKKFV